MGVLKPAASKAPAYVSPAITDLSVAVDPCCIPGGAVSGGPLNATEGEGDNMSMGDHMGHILEPTRH
jgi:hypothetical protein